MQIDETFLNPHPATLLWWEQRKQCLKCEHLELSLGFSKEQVMRCRATSWDAWPGQGKAMTHRGLVGPSCIDARLPEADCGPEGKLFRPAKKGKKG